MYNELDAVSEGLRPSVAGHALLGTGGESPHPRTPFLFPAVKDVGRPARPCL